MNYICNSIEAQAGATSSQGVTTIDARAMDRQDEHLLVVKI
jgi:hypothetical protein